MIGLIARLETSLLETHTFTMLVESNFLNNFRISSCDSMLLPQHFNLVSDRSPALEDMDNFQLRFPVIAAVYPLTLDSNTVSRHFYLVEDYPSWELRKSCYSVIFSSCSVCTRKTTTFRRALVQIGFQIHVVVSISNPLGDL